MGNFINQNIEQNDLIRIECVRLSSDGAGVGYDAGKVTFVPGLLPGECGIVEIVEKKKNWQRAKLLDIEKASSERLEPPCSVYDVCGGCQLQHMNYEQTLVWKKRWVEDALKRIGKIDVEVNPVLGMDVPWRYRNKATIHRSVKKTGKGTYVELGYYKEKSKEVVEFDDCLLLSKSMNRWVHALREIMGSNYPAIKNITLRQTAPFNDKGEGLILLDYVYAEDYIKLKTDLEKLRKECPEIHSIWGLDEKGRLKHLLGSEELKASILGLEINVTPMVFLQVNPVQAEKLYSLVLEWAELTGKETVWDLYCGTGSLALALSQKAGKVVGVEENPYSVADGKRNAEQNGIKNVQFVEGKVEEWIGKSRYAEDLFSESMDGRYNGRKAKKYNEGGKPDVVVVDPPRAGLDRRVIDELGKLMPDKIIYVSCDPGTLARDLGLLVQKGYVVERVQPVDMFCWTNHIESIVKLVRDVH